MNYLTQIDIGSRFLIDTHTNLSDPTKITNVYVYNLVTGAISVSGILLLFLLIGGGIGMIAGAGKSDPKTVEAGKHAATAALIGFLVVFSAYWIVRLVEVITKLQLIS